MKILLKIILAICIVCLTIHTTHAIEVDTIIRVDQEHHSISAPDAYIHQWYMNGEKIEGATERDLEIKETGTYKVEITNTRGEKTEIESSFLVTAAGAIIKIYIIGDSTVCNYNASAYPQAGWGQVLPAFFNTTNLTFVNNAIGGRSSRSFFEEGRWTPIKNALLPGDYVFIQWGHNDRDFSNASRYTSVADYKNYLIMYCNETKAKGAIPVLISPMVLNAWTGTTMRNVFTETGNNYRGAMLEVANQLNVAFVDLNMKSWNLYKTYGSVYNQHFIYKGFDPGEYPNYPAGINDGTHFQEMGAISNARMIVQGIGELSARADMANLISNIKPQYSIAVTVNPVGSDELTTKTSTYPQGLTVTLKTIPKTTSTFQKWNNAVNAQISTAKYTTVTSGTAATSYAAIYAGAIVCSSTITSPTTVFCAGGSVVLTSSTGASYKWFKGTTQVGTAATYMATAAGSYTVEVTNAAGCKATSAAKTITVTALPTTTITSSGTVIPYPTGSIVLNAATGTGYTYQWKKNNTNITGATTASYTATTAGSYTVTVTASTCSATSAAVVLTLAPAPLKYIYNYDNSGNLSWTNTNSWTPKAVPTAIDTVIIRTGEVQIANLNHTAPVYVETNGILRLIDTSTVAKLHLQGGTLKAYTSSPGMMLTSNITIEQASTIMAGSVAATIFTLNGTITGNANLTKTSVGILRINSTATGFKGNWIVTDGKLQLRSASGLGVCGVQVKSPARLDIEVAGASIYSLVVETGAGVDLDQPLATNVAVFGTTNILTGAYQNAAYPIFIGSTSTLNVSNSLVTLSGPTAFCQGNILTLTASSGASYIWKNNTTQVGTAAAYTSTVAGSYTVDATSAAGCKVSSAPVVTTLSSATAATITATATSFCAGGSTILTASAGTSYKWFNGTTQVGTASSYTATAAGSYTVEVTNASGCKATSAPLVISIGSAQPPTITSTASSFCAGGSVILTASAGTSYVWFNGTTQVGTSSAYTATAAGTYTVEVTNASGCKATSAATTINVTATITWYADTDNDGVGDIATTVNACIKPSGYVSTSGDACPTDVNKTAAGACGCGNLETDTDSDGTANCVDSDDDNDGAADAIDCAPLNATIGAQTIWYQDTDGDGKGTASSTLSSCTQPSGYVAIAGDDCPTDANKITAGNCGCNNTETSCLDCAGTPHGTAFFDNCTICVGGTTGNTACVTTATVNGASSTGILSTYPQPFTNALTISLKNKNIKTVTFFNSQGLIIEYRHDINASEIQMGESLSSGIYFIVIESETEVYTSKVIKY